MRYWRIPASVTRPSSVTIQTSGTNAQTAEPVRSARETGVTSARFTTRLRSCSRLSSTGSDLDVTDLLFGLLFGRRQHPHLLLQRLELIVGLLMGHGRLQLGQAAV